MFRIRRNFLYKPIYFSIIHKCKNASLSSKEKHNAISGVAFSTLKVTIYPWMRWCVSWRMSHILDFGSILKRRARWLHIIHTGQMVALTSGHLEHESGGNYDNLAINSKGERLTYNLKNNLACNCHVTINWPFARENVCVNRVQTFSQFRRYIHHITRSECWVDHVHM